MAKVKSPQIQDLAGEPTLFTAVRRYLQRMGSLTSIAPLMLVATFASSPAQRLLQSHELWATVDVCGPKDQPNTIGIRGSMPGDGNAKDLMYMRLRVQYLDPTKKEWVDLSKGDSGLKRLGSGALSRQGGLSIGIAPVVGQPAFTLRGSVSFQWRRGATVLQSATRLTTAGHTTSLAGADPRGYSAATCKLA